jgi:hypothetical protein
MEWWFVGGSCLLTGAVLLALRPFWARSYGAGAARHMAATRVGWVALAAGVVLPVAMLPGDRVFNALTWLGIVVVLIAIPFIEARRRMLGPVLMRLPRVPSQRMFVAVGAMQLTIALSMWSISPGGASLTACSGLVFVVCAVRRFELREQGIAGIENAWPWREVEYYDWVGKGRGTLHLRLYWKWWFRASGLVPVPADQREAVTRILREYAPHAAPTADWAQNSVDERRRPWQ